MKANYCIKCGAPLNGSDVCSVCGTPAAEYEMPTEEKKESVFEDDFLTVTAAELQKRAKQKKQARKRIRWCPNCYSQVPPDAEKCPHCGALLNDQEDSL